MSLRKKSRGQKRKLKALLKRINEMQPFEYTDERQEHFHVPSDRFISLHKTSGRIKTAFCRAWLSKTAEIMEQKPDGLPFCKVVACIDERDLWNSTITIFYDEDYYNCFWERNSIEQTWTSVQCKSFVQSRNIESNLKEKCCFETINDLDIDYHYKTKLWFYGDVN